MPPKKKKAKKEAKVEGEKIEIYSQDASFSLFICSFELFGSLKNGIPTTYCPIHHGNIVFFCEFVHFFFTMVNTVNVLAELLYFVYSTYYRYIYRIVHKIGPSMLVHVYVYEVTTFSHCIVQMNMVISL